jgi:Mn2+/Fe2+ NRAMP family transporter
MGLAAASIGRDAGAVLVHTLAMLVVMGAIALVVYEKLGLAILRRAWINLDLIWAVAIVAAGLFTLFT